MTRRKLLVGAAIAALVVPACGGGDAADTKGKAASSGPQRGGTLTLGFIGTLSGDTALNGELSSRGAQLAIDSINAAGGIVSGNKRYDLKMVKEDDEGSPVAGINGVSRLISRDKVLAVLGPEFAHVVIPTIGI